MKSPVLLLIFAIIGVRGDSESDEAPELCNLPPHPINPKECCLDPRIISYDIIEKCKIKVFDEMSNHIDHNKHPSMAFAGGRVRRSVVKDSSSVEESSEESKELKRDRKQAMKSNEEGDSSSSEEHYNNMKHHGHHGRNHKHHNGHHGQHGKHRHHNHHHGHHRHHDENTYYSHRNHHKQQSSSEEQKPENKHLFNIHENNDRNLHLHIMHNMQCFAECVFNETGIIENNKVNMENVKLHLQRALRSREKFIPILVEAFNMCSVKAQEFRENLKDLPMMVPYAMYQHRQQNKGICKPFAGFIAMCVKTQVFLNCPAENWRADDRKCNNAKEFLKTCPRPVYPIIFSPHHDQYETNAPLNNFEHQQQQQQQQQQEQPKVEQNQNIQKHSSPGAFGQKTPYKNYPGA